MRPPRKRRLQVCHVTTMDFIATFVIRGELSGLLRRGFDVHLVVPGKEYRRELEQEGFRVHALRMPRTPRPLAMLWAYRQLCVLFKARRFDVVHTHQAVSGFLGRMAARRAGVPLVVHTEHGLPVYRGQSWLKFHLYRQALRLAGRHTDVVLSENRQDLAHLVDWGIVPPAKVVYQGTGIDVERADRERRGADRAALRAELGLPADSFCFVMAARFESVKNHDMLFRALESTWFRDSTATCVLAGTGRLACRFVRRAKDNPARDRICFLGFRADLQRLLLAFDVLVLTSVKEGVPHVLQEAAVAGLPVIATDVLGSREAVWPGTTGSLVPLNDAPALVRELERLELNPELRRDMARAARRLGREHFDVGRVVDRLATLYEDGPLIETEPRVAAPQEAAPLSHG